MKRYAIILIVAVVLVGLSAFSYLKNLPFSTSDITIKSINALAFSPEGVLFIGDSESASIVAVQLNEKKVSSVDDVTKENFDIALSKALGISKDDLSINDIAVSPVSKTLYIGVQNAVGESMIITYANDKFARLNISEFKTTSTSLKDAVAADAKDRRGRSLRKWAISDLSYYKGNVLVSGLSNQEFGSTFRSIPYPFDQNQTYGSLEIYHAAHGQYETHSPIKTFMAAEIDGEDYLIASYTCTPLVLFPMKSIGNGKHVKGRTIGEFGNGNTPLDMINMAKEGKNYLLMSNSSRPVMKVKFDDIAAYKEELTTPVTERGGTAGVAFVTFPMVNVLQLAKLDENRFITLQRSSNGQLDLGTKDNWWIN